LAIVPNFDVFKDHQACFSSGSELSNDTFRLEGTEEAFHDGVVITVAHSAHTDLAVVDEQMELVALAGKLTALVGVMQETGCWLTSAQGHLESVFHQHRFHVVCHRPADHPAGIQIQDHCQVQPTFRGVDVGEINGMIANDKFCMIHTAQLKLRRQPSSPLYDHPRYHHPDSFSYLLDKDIDRGGTDETSLEKKSSVQASTEWGTTLGSGLSISSSMEPRDEAEPDDKFG
jgi:hypothetical protein